MGNNPKLNIVSKICLLLGLVAIIPELFGQLTIEPGSFITLKEGGSLMINTELHLKSNSDSSGFFVDQTTDGDVTITGDITVERYMAADIWHNVASPVSNETTSCFTGTNLIFWYDETLIMNDWNFGWVWDTLGSLDVFRGYDIYFDGSPVLVTYHATGSETLNTGAYNMPVTLTVSVPPEPIEAHKGWNLVGNPYPSPADWLASGWDKSDINDIKYIWDGVQDIYTIFVGGGSPIGINGGTRFIPSNQGFWVQAIQTGSLGIQNSVRIGDMTGTPDYYKITPVDYPMVSLVASGNNRSDEVVIRFIKGTTEGFDLNYDALKLFSAAESVPQLSIRSGKDILALNTLPQISDNLAIPLDFLCGKSGYYGICLSQKTKLDPDVKVYLKDERLQKCIDLATNSYYQFYHEPSYTSHRFKIYFNPTSDFINNITPENYFSVYSGKNNITIIKNTEEQVSAMMKVYNITGQLLYIATLGFEDKSSFNVNFPPGYYVVSISSNQHVSNAKILITR